MACLCSLTPLTVASSMIILFDHSTSVVFRNGTIYLLWVILPTSTKVLTLDREVSFLLRSAIRFTEQIA